MKKENKNKISLEISKLGRSGFRLYLVDAPVYDKKHYLHKKLKEIFKKLREFKVVFTLSNPQSNIDLSVDYRFERDLEGDSLISLPLNIKHMKFEITHIPKGNSLKEEKIEFIGIPNSVHRLGKIILKRIQAKSMDEARKIAFNYITPTLSRISFELDIPIRIKQIDIYDLSTNYTYMSLVSPHLIKQYGDKQETIPTPELRALFSTYREGLISDLPAYKFLCFYRIIEGIYELRKNLAAKGEYPIRPKEIIPNKKELPRDDYDYIPKNSIGRKFTWVYDNIVTPMRDSIAHFLLKSKNNDSALKKITSFDLMEDQDKLWRTALLAKFMARKMLQNEIDTILKNDNIKR